jgi:hypothetical protein
MAVFYPLENFDKYVKTKSYAYRSFQEDKECFLLLFRSMVSGTERFKTEEAFYQDLDQKLEILDKNNQL